MTNQQCPNWILCVCCLQTFTVSTLIAADKESPPAYRVRHETAVPVPMRDGIKLGASLYRPDAEGKFPCLLDLRYFQLPFQDEWGKYYASRGYVVALVDSRGRGDSEGKWEFYVNEPNDGYDTQEWLGTQPWSNGRVGMLGISYSGFTQLMPAPLANKHVKALFPLECQQTNFGCLYNDGVLQLNVIYEGGLFTRGKREMGRYFPPSDPHYRQLPILDTIDKYPDVQYVKEWIRHPQYDEYWKAYGVKEKYAQIKVPAYFMTGWYDALLHDSFRNFKGFREQGGSREARTGTRILVGPWAHGGSVDYPELNALQLRWYDYWLKEMPNGIDKEPPIKIFVMGSDVWRTENEWPLARTRYVNYYLQSSGHANSVKGDGTLETVASQEDSKPDQFTYDPQKPVPTLGGQITSTASGPRDRRSVQEREDVLVYTTGPLQANLEITGPVELRLAAASSAVDTDFTATLSDVHPDGKAIHICEGIIGVKYRDSLEHPEPIAPNKIYAYKISLWETSMVFKAGHRIRLEISSSNFPRYARNQNTGLPLGTSAKMVPANQTIYHDHEHPSYLILPIIAGR